MLTYSKLIEVKRFFLGFLQHKCSFSEKLLPSLGPIIGQRITVWTNWKFFFPSKSNFAPFLEPVDNILNDLKHTFYYNGCIVTFQIAGQRWLRKIKMFFPFLPSIIFQCITYWIRSHVTSLLAQKGLYLIYFIYFNIS